MDLTLIKGKFRVTFIDCDGQARVPSELESIGKHWKINKHERQGWLKWDTSKLEPYIFTEKKYIWVPWNILVLIWLLANKEMIPSWLNGRYLIFEGTSFSDEKGNLFYVSLYWNKHAKDWLTLPSPEKWRGEDRITKIKRRIRLIRSRDIGQVIHKKSIKSRQPELRLIRPD